QRAPDLTGINGDEIQVRNSFPEFPKKFPLAWRHTAMHIRRADRNQHTVLVDAVQTVETPEQVIPTFVWFECVESLLSPLASCPLLFPKLRLCILWRLRKWGSRHAAYGCSPDFQQAPDGKPNGPEH